jgi:hypothetical protein
MRGIYGTALQITYVYYTPIRILITRIKLMHNNQDHNII